MGIASIAATAIALLVLGIFLIVMLNIQLSLEEVESNLEIVVWMDVEADHSSAADVESRINNLPEVAELEFIPKEEGMRELSAYFGSADDELLEKVGGENPLPDYFVVSVSDPHFVEETALEIKTFSAVEKVDYGQSYLEDILYLLNWVRLIGISIILLLLFAVLFLIANTIRLTIFARKNEIKVMKNVGAADWFIRWPFLLEGMVLGFMGSVVAAGILYIGYLLFIDKIALYITFLPLMTDAVLLRNIALAMIVLGTALGGLASYLSLGRYLRV